MLRAVGVIVALVASAPAQPPPTECAVVDTIGQCLVSAIDPGRPGRDEPETDDDEPRTPRRNPRPVEAGEAEPPAPPPPRGPAQPFGDGGWVVGDEPDIAGLQGLLADEQAVAAPGAVAVEVLAQRAIEALEIDPPELRMSVEGTAFVGVPLWLWIDGGADATGPVSTTATVGAARVTATARLSSVEWSMGPPGALVRCAGPGTPWAGQEGPSPDCGYAFAQRSLPERTGSRGAWTVTATAVWSVTWSGVSGGVPVEGTDTVALSSEAELPVGEVQVLVGGGGR